MKKSLTFTTALFLVTWNLFSQIPIGYYDSVNNQTGEELKLALYNIIKGHNKISDEGSKTIFAETDADPDVEGNILLIYSNHSVSGEWNSGEIWNREHVWPTSRGDLGSSSMPNLDLHNLRACIPYINYPGRSNRWFAECDEPYVYEEINTGSYTSSIDWIWKPRNEDKGDVARIILYMATRYEGESDEPDLEPIDSIPLDNNTNDPVHALLSDLLKWHIEDPVSDFERNRNEVIYSYQNNRNPFIDHPEYVAEIWDIDPETQYYHPFQNFDDDVDRMKTYSNFLGGNSGIWHEGQFTTEYDTIETRSSYGRSLKINYGPLNDWSMYFESFSKKADLLKSSFNLNNLFPDYSNDHFQNRKIDSLVFYAKLDSYDTLSLKLELSDSNEHSSVDTIHINPSSEWQRISLGLNEFSGTFNKSIAKFLAFVFDQGLNNQNESGTLWIDDFYLVENGYYKPEFTSETEMLEYINQVSFRHFWMAVDPVSKFALDRHTWDDLISVDAIGFQLSSYIIAHKEGWIDSYLIEARVEHILNYLLNECEHATDSFQVKSNPLGYASVQGNWVHFLRDSTLARKDINTEFSLFTNALLLSGVITAKEYFSQNTNITAYADSLYRMTDWNFLLRSSDTLMYYAWKPESGYSKYYTDWFTEELDLAFLLGISSPNINNRLKHNPYFSSGYTRQCCIDNCNERYVYSAPGSNFTYYFLQMYAKYDPFELRFINSQNALKADVEFCENEYELLNYDARIFGTTACEGPDSAGENISNYHAYGYSCKLDENNQPNGTVAIYGSGASVPFIPSEASSCLSYYYNELDSIFINDYKYSFWSPIFGFPDAFHLNPDLTNDSLINSLNFNGPWLSVPRFGIDVGPMLMNIDSYISELNEETSIRDIFSQSEYISPNLNIFDTVLINCNPTATEPTANITTLDTTICEGETVDISVDLTGAAPWNISYTDGETTTTVTTTNNPYIFLVSEAGIYEITSLSDAYCAGTDLSGSTTVIITSLPTAHITTKDTAICEGETITILIGLTGIAPWDITYTDGTTPTLVTTSNNPYTFLVSEAGIYEVTSLSDAYCAGTDLSGSTTVIITPLPTAHITTKDTTICEGETIDISIDLSGTTPWDITYTDGTTPTSVTTSNNPYTFSISEAGTYEVTSLSDTNCTGTDLGKSISVTVKPKPVAEFTYVQDYLTVTFINYSKNADFYIWDFGDGDSSTITNPVHIYANPGEYLVELTSLNSYCPEAKMDSTIDVPNSINTMEFEDLVKIIPNPSKGLLTIEINNSNVEEILIEVIDLNGQIIYKKQFNSTKITEIINLSEKAKGIYLVRVKLNSFERVGKLLIY